MPKKRTCDHDCANCKLDECVDDDMMLDDIKRILDDEKQSELLKKRENALTSREIYEIINREKIKQKRHQYYLENKERILEKNRKYYADNKDHVLSKQKLRYASDEMYREMQRILKRKNPQKFSDEQKKRNAERRICRMNPKCESCMFAYKVHPVREDGNMMTVCLICDRLVDAKATVPRWCPGKDKDEFREFLKRSKGK